MSAREALACRCACVAIALFLFDDAFVHPEPGMGAGDHLLSGLLPLAVVAAFAVAVPRLHRAGFAAAAVLALGLSALVAGIAVPIRHIGLQGPSGDDATGVLAMLGGAVLAALGTRILWRTRRRDTRLWRRYLRRAAVTVAAFVVAVGLVLPVPFAFIATHKARSDVKAANLGRPYAAVSLRTSDGLRLRGWYVQSRNRAAVVAFPGRTDPVTHARMLAEHGYGVLLLDRRGEGQSDGDYNALGYGGDRDLIAAVRFLQHRPDVDPRRVGALGLSVGGEIALQTAAQTSGLRAVVSEGAGVRSHREQLDMPGGGRWTTLPFWAMTSLATAVFGHEPLPPDLESLVPRIAPRPLFLIWATHGNGEEVNAAYLRAAGDPKVGWQIPEAEHTGGLAARPAEYERRVIAFFDRALGPVTARG